MSEPAIKVGDIVQYVWGMPGPDFDEGPVCKVHDDGSFDADFSGRLNMLGKVKCNIRLSEPGAPIVIGFCAKKERPNERA